MLNAVTKRSSASFVQGNQSRNYSTTTASKTTLRKRASTKLWRKSVMAQYNKGAIAVRQANPDQRLATHDEIRAILQGVTKKRDELKLQLALLHWAEKVPTMTYLRVRKEIQRRIDAPKHLHPAFAESIMEDIQILEEVSPYLSQDVLVAALKASKIVHKLKSAEQLVLRFTTHYNEYLEWVELKQQLQRMVSRPLILEDQTDKETISAMRARKKVLDQILPYHFIEDVKQGMNLELLELLVQRRCVKALASYLDAVPLPPHTPPVLLNKLIKVDPVLMTSRLGPRYSPEQVTLACMTLMKHKKMAGVSALLFSVPTRIYTFNDFHALVNNFTKNDKDSGATLARLVVLSSPEAFDSKTYSATCRHLYKSTSNHWSTLQKLVSSHGYDLEWLVKPQQLSAFLHKAFALHQLDFVFQCLSKLSQDRIEKIKRFTIDDWATNAIKTKQDAITFMRGIAPILEQFKLTLPLDKVLTERTKIVDQQKIPSKKVETPSEVEAISWTSTTLASESEFYQLVLPPIPTAAGKLDAPSIASKSSTEGKLSPGPASAKDDPEYPGFLLSLKSNDWPLKREREDWSEQERLEHLEQVQSFVRKFGVESLPVSVWASYTLCLLAQHDAGHHDQFKPIIFTHAKAFEVRFMTKRPEIGDREKSIVGVALTKLAQFLWSEGRHSSAMSLAIILNFYNLRTDRNFEVLVREQSMASQSVHGTSNLSWFHSVVEDEAVDPSFFNSLLAFFEASIKFDLNRAIQTGLDEAHQTKAAEIWKSLHLAWTRAMTVNWTPSPEFVSLLLKMAQIQGVEPKFFTEALLYCQTHGVSLAPRDLPLSHLLTSLMKTSNHALAQHLLSSTGLNMLSSLPASLANHRPLTNFIMRSLASAQDYKNAISAYRLYSGQEESGPSQELTLIETFFHKCKANRNFAVAEKFFRGIVTDSTPVEAYLMIIELAGQCGELSSALRIYKDAVKKWSSGPEASALISSVLRAVAACNVLPLEAHRLRAQLELPDATYNDQLRLTEDFITSIDPSQLTRRSKPVYLSL